MTYSVIDMLGEADKRMFPHALLQLPNSKAEEVDHKMLLWSFLLDIYQKL